MKVFSSWQAIKNMARFEWILNKTANRFQLNYKRNVGATSASIRACKPKTKDEWRKYYFSKVKSEQDIQKLGEKLYEKVQTVVKKEAEEITKDECIAWMQELVIDRTYDGYINEIEIIRGDLEPMLKVKIEEAPDEWDRTFGVDFFIKIRDRYIGLQIKPTDAGYTDETWATERAVMQANEKRFTEKFGGKVFIIYSIKEGDKKVIQNKSVVDEIKHEIARLSS